MTDLSHNENVRRILKNSQDDPNYRAAIPRLTDQELLYCLARETRSAGRKRLLAEARRRRLPM